MGQSDEDLPLLTALEFLPLEASNKPPVVCEGQLCTSGFYLAAGTPELWIFQAAGINHMASGRCATGTEEAKRKVY